MVTKFDKNKKYIFDMNLYVPKIKDNERQWPMLCNHKEVNIVTENKGFIIINGISYHMIPIWCREKPAIKKMVIKDGEEL